MLRHYQKTTKFGKNLPPVSTKQLFYSVVGDFFKFLCLFQKSWTLQNTIRAEGFFYLLMQSQSMQYCLMTLAPQQSPPSNMQKGLLFTSSHESSEIQISSPPASTEIISSFEIKNLIVYQKLKVYCSLLLQTELSLGIPVVVG